MTWNVFFDLLGWAGMGGFAACHLLLSMKVLKVNTFYQCLQLTAAACLGTSAFWFSFYQSVGLELFWAFVSMASIVGYRRAAQSASA